MTWKLHNCTNQKEEEEEGEEKNYACKL